MPIDPGTAEALRIVARLLEEEGRDFVIIGALVPQMLADARGGLSSGVRTTRDLDAVVRVLDWVGFRRLRQDLLDRGFRPGPEMHRLRFSEDVQIDLIPFGPGTVQDDRIVWPDTENVMSTTGFEEAFASARLRKVGPHLSLPVVTIPGLVLLKIAAYLDRPAERARDLTDIVLCLEHYEGNGGENRRFSLAGVEVEGQPIQFDEAGAFLVGADLAGLATERSKAEIRRFLGLLPDEYARPINQILREEARVLDEEDRRTQILRLFRVFSAGLGEGTHPTTAA